MIKNQHLHQHLHQHKNENAKSQYKNPSPTNTETIELETISSNKSNLEQKDSETPNSEPKPTKEFEKPKCPYCNKNKFIVKIGHRTNKTKKVQRFRCNFCNKTFINQPLKYTTYSPKIIFNAISTYNLGHTEKQTVKIIARKHKINIPITTIHSWLNRYQDICTFTSTLRKRYKLDPQTHQLFFETDLPEGHTSGAYHPR